MGACNQSQMMCEDARFGQLLYSHSPIEEYTQGYETLTNTPSPAAVLNSHSAWMYPTNSWLCGTNWHATTPTASPDLAGQVYHGEVPSFQKPQLYGPVGHCVEQGLYQGLSYVKPFETASQVPTLDRVLYQAPLDTYATMTFNKATEMQNLAPGYSQSEPLLASSPKTISRNDLQHTVVSPPAPKEPSKKVSSCSYAGGHAADTQSHHVKRTQLGSEARPKRAYAVIKSKKPSCPRPAPFSGLISLKDLDIPADSAKQEERDLFLVRAKSHGMAYSEIKRLGHFREAVSTLRGRFRTLTKTKEARVRQPQWSQTDVSCSCSCQLFS